MIDKITQKLETPIDMIYGPDMKFRIVTCICEDSLQNNTYGEGKRLFFFMKTWNVWICSRCFRKMNEKEEYETVNV